MESTHPRSLSIRNSPMMATSIARLKFLYRKRILNARIAYSTRRERMNSKSVGLDCPIEIRRPKAETRRPKKDPNPQVRPSDFGFRILERGEVTIAPAH